MAKKFSGDVLSLKATLFMGCHFLALKNLPLDDTAWLFALRETFTSLAEIKIPQTTFTSTTLIHLPSSYQSFINIYVYEGMRSLKFLLPELLKLKKNRCANCCWLNAVRWALVFSKWQFCHLLSYREMS